jgi:hypothetical protein
LQSRGRLIPSRPVDPLMLWDMRRGVKAVDSSREVSGKRE